MTTNRTSQLLQELLETMQPLEIRMAFPAIARKYLKMEEALRGYSDYHDVDCHFEKKTWAENSGMTDEERDCNCGYFKRNEALNYDPLSQ
jgi:hypothetical protein